LPRVIGDARCGKCGLADIGPLFLKPTRSLDPGQTWTPPIRPRKTHRSQDELRDAAEGKVDFRKLSNEVRAACQGEP
jgi:hypothetical protein